MTEALATVLVFIGVYLMAQPDIRGYYFMVVSQVLWFAFAVMNQHYMLALQSSVLLVFNFYGIRNWRAKKVGM